MALQKTVYTSDNTGCAATYWKICDVTSDWMDGHCEIEIMGFLSQQASDDGRSPLIIKTYEVRNELFDVYFSFSVMNAEGVNMVGQCYQYIKDYSGEFSDAVDV